MRDDFLRRLAWDLRHQCTGKFLDRMRRFYVDDIFGDEAEVIFVCESPHTSEVRGKFPLAGRAGSVVTQKIYGKILRKSRQITPIGRLLHDGCKDLHWLGIMNICPIPMQAGPYKEFCDSNLIKSMKTIRNGPKVVRRKNPITFRVEETILYSFKHRVVELRGRFPYVIMIPCGGFAEAFFEKSCVSSFMHGVPHPSPSRGRPRPWNVSIIDTMCSQIKQYIGV